VSQDKLREGSLIPVEEILRFAQNDNLISLWALTFTPTAALLDEAAGVLFLSAFELSVEPPDSSC
jgi:hypothetical protein